MKLILLIFLASAGFAQIDPQGAQVISYFPHLTDGGPASQKWVTSFTFVNPHQTIPTAAIVQFFNDDGSPLSLDFGNGPSSTFTFTVPPQGTITFKSTAASSIAVSGWAVVVSSLPLEGIVQFTFSVNGVPQQGVTAQATPASHLFRSPATPSTGIALANPYPVQTLIGVTVYDAGGKSLGQSSLTLPPSGHHAFNLSQMFSGLPSNFHGSVVVSTAAASLTGFVAWTLSADGGVLANYPPSGSEWPVSQVERILKVWEKIFNAATWTLNLPMPSSIPKLVIDPSTGAINSYADVSKNEVHIFLNLAELISDSESELGFVVGHELGHIIQGQAGLVFNPGNAELDADQYGMLLALVAGYDPYGAAGALSKLAMASGTAGLVSQNFDNLSALAGGDIHGSFNNRLQLLFEDMQDLCSLPSAQSACNSYKSAVHPHLPSSVPLSLRPSANRR